MSKPPRVTDVRHLGALILLLAGVSSLAIAQSDWTTPRTAWGDPDLQGKWTFANTGTPMERPPEYGDREFLTPEEIAARVEAAAAAVAAPEDPEEARDEAQATAARPSEQGIFGQEYNRFWVIEAERAATAWDRTSLVIDPPDGRIPPLTIAAVERLEQREAARAHGQRAGNPPVPRLRRDPD
jgi:hypothetical protein